MVATDRDGPREGRWDASSNATSYIDDGCPTIWRGSTPDAGASQRRYERGDSRRKGLDSTPRSATRVKPINGDLLQRLFRATMDEKRRVVEEARIRDNIPDSANYVLEAKPQSSNRQSNGLYIPEHLKRQAEDIKRRQREEASPRTDRPSPSTAHEVSAGDAEEVPKQSAKQKKKSKKGRKHVSPRDIEMPETNGEETIADIPIPLIEGEIPEIVTAEKLAFPSDEQDLDPVTEGQEAELEKKKSKKKAKRKGKKQKEADERAVAAEVAAEAIMSGALPSGHEEPILVKDIATSERSTKPPFTDLQAIDYAEKGTHSRRTHRHRKAHSRSQKSTSTSSKPSRADSSPVRKAPSTRATSMRALSQKAASALSFEAVGEGWAGDGPSHAIVDRSVSRHSPKRSTPQSVSRDLPTSSSFKESQDQASNAHGSANNQSKHPQDWEAIAQPTAGARSEAQDDWAADPGSGHQAPSVRSLKGVGTGWDDSLADDLSPEARSSIHSRLVPIDGGKAVALQWGEETSERSRSNKIAAKNLFNIPILMDVEPVRHASTRASSKKIGTTLSSDMHAKHDARSGSGRSRSSRRVSQSASAHDFEEVADGWYHATPEVGCSCVSRSRSQSRVRTSVSYGVGVPAGGELGEAQTSEHSKVHSFAGSKGNSTAWPVGEHEAGSRHSQSQKIFSYRPSVYDWANASRKSDGAVSWNAEPQSHSKSVSMTSGYGWENQHQSRQSSEVRSGKRCSVKQSTTSDHHLPSQPIDTYNEAEGEHNNRENDASPDRESRKSVCDRSQPQYPREHPTIFAGKGWISPHPLSEAPSAIASPPASRIVLPEEAFPQGATMTYEEWQALQERGMRSHRNFSQTESDQTRRAKRHHDRYKFAGWGAQSSDGHRFEHESSKHSKSGHSRSEKSGSDRTGVAENYHAPTVTSEQSSEVLFSDEQPRTITSDMLKDDRSVHDSHTSSKRESLLSRIRTLTSWSQDHSGSKEAYDGSGKTHSSRHSSRRSSERSGSRKHSERYSSDRHSHRSSRHDSKEHSKHSSDRHSSGRHSSHRNSRHTAERRSGHSSSVREREMEVMEEGRNEWSEIPQYDGTTSIAEEQEFKARSEVSRTATSQLYLNRYRAEEASSNGYEF